MNENDTLIALGTTDLRITPLGIGAWSWGDRLVWGFGRGYQQTDVQEAFDTSLEAGINFFDTAEVYGQGRSERLIGELIHRPPTARDHPSLGSLQPVIATKFMPYPWRLQQGSLKKALQASLKRLAVESVDLYQIHWPLPPLSVETWAEGLARIVQEGLARAVGVSNYSELQMRRAYLTLQKHGIPLASNQVEYNLLNRKAESNGLLKTCHEMNVTLIAYSPLAMGALSGKYTPENPPPGVRGRRYPRSLLVRLQPLIRRLQQIGQDHGGKTPAQVALNWVICKGAVPIPGAKNARQARENTSALSWRLTTDEVAALDEASDQLTNE